jgi:hypothetical protein
MSFEEETGAYAAPRRSSRHPCWSPGNRDTVRPSAGQGQHTGTDHDPRGGDRRGPYAGLSSLRLGSTFLPGLLRAYIYITAREHTRPQEHEGSGARRLASYKTATLVIAVLPAVATAISNVITLAH